MTAEPVYICADALEWLAGRTGVGAIITSTPDAEEMDLSLSAWEEWFRGVVKACVAAADQRAPVVFYQTDRKVDGGWYSKATIIMDAARSCGARVLWHKIAVRSSLGAVDFFRPGYSHMIAMSIAGGPGKPTADAFYRGPVIYANAIGMTAARIALACAKQSTGRVVDPFCGRGTVPALAAELGMEATGIDIDPVQIELARSMRITAKIK